MSDDTSRNKKSGEVEKKPLPPQKQEISESERIQELRERLYARGETPHHDVRHTIPPRRMGEISREKAPPTHVVSEKGDTEKNVPRELALQVPVHEVHHEVKDTTSPAVQYESMKGSKRSSFRKWILLGGVFFFILAVLVSSVFMFLGKNTISGENISLTMSGPISVGGGEEFSFQISVANQNTIPIESVVLIIEYPDGTQSATEPNKEIGIVRETLDTVETGEVVNVPLKVRIFGEENEEQEIRVKLEYRVSGSNGTFEKTATPLRYKVSSSPVVMTFDSVEAISSGQELSLTLTVQSNSPAPLSDLLVKAVYPGGFDFTEASPDTVAGEDTWKISTLKPGEKKVITIRGLMTGYEDDARIFGASVGVANVSDKNVLASVLAKAETEVAIEKSFVDIGVRINSVSEETVVIKPNDTAVVEVSYRNALDSALYDGEVLVELSGNALNEFNVRVDDGFYDSSNNTVRFDSADNGDLKEILPGSTKVLTFVIDPDEDVGKAPEVKLKVTARGKRLSEDRVPEEIGDAVLRVIRVESVHTLQSFAFHGVGEFTNTGPVPPVAEETTQYTLSFVVRAGSNDVTGAEVTAVLPQYVKWLDLVSEDDTVTYNATTRTLKWTIGDMKANKAEEVSMQVSFKPSLSQVGSTPTILETQRFKATDRFTGTVVRSEAPALTTSLQNEEDQSLVDGKVRSN